MSERFDRPIARATALARRALALRPVRVWRHFLGQNGFLLAAGLSYQALFAVFAALYVAFAVAGIWLTGDRHAYDALVSLINTFAPGLIGEHGVIDEASLQRIATSSTSLFGVTGAVALAGFVWTAIGWVTYARISVRAIFGLAKDGRNFVLLKARDLLAATLFGAVLLIATGASIVATTLLDFLFGALGWGHTAAATASQFTTQAITYALVFVIDTVALVFLFRFISGTALRLRRMMVGSVLGSGALTVLQVLGGLLVSGVTSNPLLATFAVFIGLLLWFRLTSIVILAAASWIAVEADDAGETIGPVSPAEHPPPPVGGLP